MFLKGNYLETLNYAISKESLLIIFAVLENIVNILMFHDRPNLVLINGVMIIIVYFLLSNRNDKKELAFTLFHFSFWGIIESFLIHKMFKTLSYKNPKIKI